SPQDNQMAIIIMVAVGLLGLITA
nr:protein 2K [Zika virus]YP_009430306.1 protein 2K [Zika virus]